MRKTSLLLFSLLLVGLVAGPATARSNAPGNAPGHAHGASDPSLGAQLAAVRAATARYHDVTVALEDDYVPATPCVVHPDLGTMGYHYVNLELLGLSGDDLDPTRPQALLYIPDPDIGLRLVGVEYLSTDADETMFGQPFQPGPAGPALHVWVWANNPAGMFADYNPSISC